MDGLRFRASSRIFATRTRARSRKAETDAMKRALMTFGNPFGLALYDKDKTNVCDDPPEPAVSDEAKQQFHRACLKKMEAFDNVNALGEWWKSDGQKKGVATSKLNNEQVGLCERTRPCAAATICQKGKSSMSGHVNKVIPSAILVPIRNSPDPGRQTVRQPAHRHIGIVADKSTGERKGKDGWHRVVIFNGVCARSPSSICAKGAKVYIEGHCKRAQMDRSVWARRSIRPKSSWNVYGAVLDNAGWSAELWRQTGSAEQTYGDMEGQVIAEK